MTKQLTISIPTWNRADLLNELLKILCIEIRKQELENKIQILVSNNASDDNTDEVVAKYNSAFKFISYYRNETNIGAKLNVLKSMELATTPYVMFIGDDDRINISNLINIFSLLEKHNTIGVLLDTCISKFIYSEEYKIISVEELVRNIFWYMGNASVFVVRTNFIKENLAEFGYDFYNECWPQTQLMLQGLTKNPDTICIAGNFNIPSSSVHTQVMSYTSFYLWRTCYYELLLSVNALRKIISPEVYSAARLYMKKSLKQQLFNILQCGIFVDGKQVRKKTSKHIFKNLGLFTMYEKIFLLIIIIALSIPTLISKPASDIFIYFLKGRAGLKKKNDFVKNELHKKAKQNVSKNSIRELDFEK